MDTMFDKLLLMPLFQGLMHNDLTYILEKVKLNFVRHDAGECLINKDSPCKQLVFIMRGKISFTTTADDGSFSITEFVEAPYVIEPYSILGRYTSYASTYRAETEVTVFNISKELVMQQLFRFDIFRLNYLNIITKHAQVKSRNLWVNPACDIRSRILHFIWIHLDKPTGRKIVKIKMRTLGRIIKETRISVSHVLNEWEYMGLVVLHRGSFIIPDAGKLFDVAGYKA